MERSKSTYEKKKNRWRSLSEKAASHPLRLARSLDRKNRAGRAGPSRSAAALKTQGKNKNQKRKKKNHSANQPT